MEGTLGGGQCERGDGVHRTCLHDLLQVCPSLDLEPQYLEVVGHLTHMSKGTPEGIYINELTWIFLFVCILFIEIVIILVFF